MIPKSFLLALLLTISCHSFSQQVTMDELLNILKIKAHRLPNIANSVWNIDIIPDTLQKIKKIPINEVLKSGKTSLLALKQDNDTTVSFTLIETVNSTVQGSFPLKQKDYYIHWYDVPEQVSKNVFAVARIGYTENTSTPIKYKDDLIVAKIRYF